MTQNKFEKEIKEKLQAREIKPSTKAWDKVSAGLDEALVTKGKYYYGYGIAAGFIGLLIISVLYFRDGSIPAGQNEMVENPVETTEAVQDQADRSVIPEKNEDVTVTEFRDKPGASEDPSIVHSKHPSPAKATLVIRGSDTSKVADKAEKASELFIEAKLAEVVAKVNVLENGKQALSDLEVDSLLRQAQEELLIDHSPGDTSVNAMALLMEVEDEIDESFREKLFDKLKEGFQKIRTAVADRNN